MPEYVARQDFFWKQAEESASDRTPWLYTALLGLDLFASSDTPFCCLMMVAVKGWCRLAVVPLLKPRLLLRGKSGICNVRRTACQGRWQDPQRAQDSNAAEDPHIASRAAEFVKAGKETL